MQNIIKQVRAARIDAENAVLMTEENLLDHYGRRVCQNSDGAENLLYGNDRADYLHNVARIERCKRIESRFANRAQVA